MAAGTSSAESGSPLGLIAGVLLCAGVAAVALGLGRLEADLTGRAWVEPLVIALLIGAAVRTLWGLPRLVRPGVDFSARTVLEVAIVLLGASLSSAALAAVGPGLIIGVFAVVLAALAAGYAIGRALGLSKSVAILVASGNAICGNSAIAAVAPVIGAKPEEVSVSIGFTAALSLALVLLLPVLAALLGLSEAAGGALAGLTVYAVPQVLAAAAPMGAAALDLGTLVKLVRVLALGPLCVALALMAGAGRRSEPGARLRLDRLVPWFILGFLAMAGLRSAGLIPVAWLEPLDEAAGLLTLVAMAALGLSTDLRMVARSGPRVAAAVALSLAALLLLGLGLIWLLRL